MNDVDLTTLTWAALEAAKSVYKQWWSDNDVIATLKHNNLLPNQSVNIDKNVNKGDEVKGFMEKMEDNWNKFTSEGFESAWATRRWEQSLPENLVQQFWNTAAFWIDTIFSALWSAYETLWAPLKEEIKDWLKYIGETDIWKMGLDALWKTVEVWDEFALANPRAARNIEGVFESIEVVPVWWTLIRWAKGIEISWKEKIATYFENKAVSLWEKATQVEKWIHSDTTSLLKPADREYENVWFDEVPKVISDTANVMKPAKSFEELWTNIETIWKTALSVSNDIVAKSPDLDLNIENILRPLYDEIAKVAKDPQRTAELKILTNVFKKESELLESGKLLWKTWQERKKGLNKILWPYLEKRDLTVEENSHKSAINLLRKWYKKEMDGVYWKEYKKNNELSSSLISASKLLKKQRSKSMKGSELWLTKKLARRFLLVRAFLNQSTFIANFIDRLTPEELMVMYSKRITKSKKKLDKILAKQKVFAWKAIDYNKDKIADAILDIVWKEYVWYMTKILPLIDKLIEKYWSKAKEHMWELLEDVVEKLWAKTKFLEEKDVEDFLNKPEAPLIKKEKSKAYWILKELEQQQRLKSPDKFMLDELEREWFNPEDFLDNWSFTPKTDNIALLKEMWLIWDDWLFTDKLYKTFPKFKESFESLGKWLHSPKNKTK